jgi:hypothetical protein
VLEFALGNGASAATLVEQNDVETALIEKLQVMAVAATTRSAMQEKYRFATWRTVSLPIEMMAVVCRVVAIPDH